MSVEITELPPAPVAVRPLAAIPQRRGAHRVAQTTVRRTRQRWAAFSVTILGCMFGLTVGILDVLH